MITRAELASSLFSGLESRRFFSLLRLDLSSKPHWFNQEQWPAGPGSLTAQIAKFIGWQSCLEHLDLSENAFQTETILAKILKQMLLNSYLCQSLKHLNLRNSATFSTGKTR